MKKKTLSLAVTALLVLGLLAGCSSGGSGTVNTDGSTSMADVMGALTEAFKEREPNITVNYSGTGSGSGISGVLDGTCDIGLSSRELKQEEMDKGAVAHVVALDGVAVVVNPKNPVSDLTTEANRGHLHRQDHELVGAWRRGRAHRGVRTRGRLRDPHGL